MVTALIALVIGVYELQATREYQRLSVEPYLELAYTNADGFQILLSNSGLGPARIKTADVKFDGIEVSNWREVVTAMGLDDSLKFTYASMWAGRQIKTGETVAIMTVGDQEQGKLFQKSWNKLSIDICYCSIYSECWIKNTSNAIAPVSACPAGAPSSFPRHKSAS